jgi:spore protease
MQEKILKIVYFLLKIAILNVEVINLNFLPRTDLAAEDLENEGKSEVENYNVGNLNVQKIALDETNAKKYGKKEGIYYTVTTDAIIDLEHDLATEVSITLAKILEDIYEEYNLTQESYILVLGLGNDEITPDSLGPKAVKNIFVTKHLADLGQLDEGLGIIGAIAPGVMGQTGIETSDIIRALVKKTKPELVLVIDALASRSLHRVNRTVQISTAGINPGSGVGNKRKEISYKTLGVPVVAIGVPTVVDIASIFYDIKDFFNETDDEIDIRSSLIESDLNFMVTNKDIDEMMNMMADIISKAVNISIHNLEIYE